jgi:hypothetical protein
MSNVGAVEQKVNGSTSTHTASIDDVIRFVVAQVKKGDMGEASGNVRITALKQMHGQVAEGEPGDAQWVADNIERLRERWARKNPGGATLTVKTYASRAHAIIEEYFRWAAAPDKYDPKREKIRAGDGAKTKKTSAPRAAAPAETPPAPPMPQPAPGPANTVAGDVRSCPLGTDREPFRYILPADGLKVKDARRIAYHLITMCDDYDPEQMSPSQAMVVARD